VFQNDTFDRRLHGWRLVPGHSFVGRVSRYTSYPREARQVEGWIAGLKKRIPLLRRSIAECDRMASDLDQEVRNEEARVKVHDPANIAYSIYAKATASRRDNLRRSADELRSHLSKAEQQLGELGGASPL
jgi:hypothetical protein